VYVRHCTHSGDEGCMQYDPHSHMGHDSVLCATCLTPHTSCGDEGRAAGLHKDSRDVVEENSWAFYLAAAL